VVEETGRGPQARLALAADYAACAAPFDERVSVAEVVELVREATAARSGWKRIFGVLPAGVRDASLLAE